MQLHHMNDTHILTEKNKKDHCWDCAQDLSHIEHIMNEWACALDSKDWHSRHRASEVHHVHLLTIILINALSLTGTGPLGPRIPGWDLTKGANAYAGVYE